MCGLHARARPPPPCSSGNRGSGFVSPGHRPPRAQPLRVAASPAREPDRPASCPQGAMEQAELGSVLPSGHLHPAHNFCSVGFFQKS